MIADISLNRPVTLQAVSDREERGSEFSGTVESLALKDSSPK